MTRHETGTYRKNPKTGQYEKVGGQFASETQIIRKTSGHYNPAWILAAAIFTFTLCTISAIALLEAKAAREESEALRAQITGLQLADKLTDELVKQNADDINWLTKSHLRNAEAQNEALDILQSRIILKR